MNQFIVFTGVEKDDIKKIITVKTNSENETAILFHHRHMKEVKKIGRSFHHIECHLLSDFMRWRFDDQRDLGYLKLQTQIRRKIKKFKTEPIYNLTI